MASQATTPATAAAAGQAAAPTTQDLINAIIAAMTAAAGVVGPAAAPVVPPAAQAPYAVMPGAANTNVLDFNKPDALKLFNKAITALDVKFDLVEEKLRTFLEQIRERARIYNWDGLLAIEDDGKTPRNLIDRYGMLTMDNCRAHATAHLAVQNRMYQDSMMLYQFLKSSLTEKAQLTMLGEKDTYYVNDTPSGVCFLKAIIGRSSIDSTAKVSMLRKRIATLPSTIMSEHSGNIRTFNTHVAELREQLVGRGKGVEELTTFLFDAYLNVPDEEFKRYIEVYRDRNDEGTPIDEEKLMRVALNKYEVIQHRKSKSNEGEERMMALTAKTKGVEDSKSLESLMAAIKDLQANFAKRESGDKGNGEKTKKKGRKVAEWKRIAPEARQPQSKTVNEKMYHWCTHHKMWTIHSPKDCTLGQQGNGNSSNTSNSKTSIENARLTMNRAMTAIYNDDPEE
jgi:hypothetical protein